MDQLVNTQISKNLKKIKIISPLSIHKNLRIQKFEKTITIEIIFTRLILCDWDHIMTGFHSLIIPYLTHGSKVSEIRKNKKSEISKNLKK